MTRSFTVFILHDLTGNDYQTVVDNVHGELVKELRGDIVVAILQFHNNKSSTVSIPYIKPEAKVAKPEACLHCNGPQHSADYADGRVQQLEKFKATREVQNLQGNVKEHNS